MARRNGIRDLLKDADKIFATTIYNGPKAAAERIVRDLQERGPAWSGRFSNSWQIKTPTALTRGTGSPGKPLPIYTPALTGLQVTTSFLGVNKVVFVISNFADYADIATDLEPGVFINPGTTPLKPLTRGKRQQSLRGLLKGAGSNTRTAPFDWFSLYVKGGYIDKTIEIAMRTTR
jgi:hypothetical protein